MIIYLDQNKWIELAQAQIGKNQEPGLVTALQRLTQRVQAKADVVPLSAIHYTEIAVIRKPERRERLGQFMYELSGGATIASYADVLRWELEQALARRFPSVTPRPFTFLSRGVAHAFGMPVRRGLTLPTPVLDSLGPSRFKVYEEAVDIAIERALLTGVGPDGSTMLPTPHSRHATVFRDHLAKLGALRDELPKAKYEDALTAILIADMHELLHEVLTFHNLVLADLLGRGSVDLRAFVDELPTRRIDIHLHRQVLRNPHYAAKLTDLNDWGGLGPAAAHCDVVVCEKHFADLLRRDGFKSPAVVLTDIRQLSHVTAA